jgi:pilus assembly protein CpaB
MGRRTIVMIVAFVIAAFGATLIFLYVQGVDSRALANAEPVEVLIATAPIDAGEEVSAAAAAGKLELTEVAGNSVLDGALTSTDTIDGQVALAPLYTGEQVIAEKFGDMAAQSRITIPDKMLAVSVELTNPQRVAGFVSPGSKVAIFTTPVAGVLPEEGEAEPQVRLLLTDVQVVGVGQTGMASDADPETSEGEVVDPVDTTILTVALSQTDAERLVLADTQGELAFALLTDDSEVAPSEGTGVGGLFAGKGA